MSESSQIPPPPHPAVPRPAPRPPPLHPARHRTPLLLVECGAPQRDGHRCTLNHVASGGGDEARAHGLAGRDLDHPGRTLLVATPARPDHATAHEVLDELPDDVAVRAEDDIIELRVAHELERAR